MTLTYSPEYYSRLSGGIIDSAKAVVPMVLKLVAPSSIVDLGCGIGIWLAEFKRQGVTDILGVDGPHIQVDQLHVHPNEFLAADLAQPLKLNRRFDLAMSLEVGEHLEPEQADQLVKSLTDLAPVVLFSAAIPYQGGEHHVNEQWPAYWVERFAARDYIAADPFRRLLWSRSDVDWWYAQNLFLFVRRDQVDDYPSIAAWKVDPAEIPTYVHPRNYLQLAWQNRVLSVAVDLVAETHLGDQIIVADEDRLGTLYLPGRGVRSFIERDNAYFGPPRDDEQAICELERMLDEGCAYFAICWPAFWWLDHYKRFKAYLQSTYPIVLRNNRLILYRLQRSH